MLTSIRERISGGKLLKELASVWVLRGGTLACRFLLTVYAVRVLTPAEFGEYALLTAGLAIGVYLAGLQFYVFNLRELASTNAAPVQASFIKDQLVLHATVHAVLLPAAAVIPGVAPASFLVWFVGLLLAEHASQEGYRLLVALSRAQAANAIFFVRSGLWILAWMGYSFVASPTLRSLCVFWLAGSALSVALAVAALRHLPWKSAFAAPVDWVWIRNGLRVSAIYCAIVLFYAVAQYFSRYVLNASRGAAEVGVYFFFVSMASPVYTLVEVGPYAILQPRLLRFHAAKARQEYRRAMQSLGLSVAGTTVVGVAGTVAVTLIFVSVTGRTDLAATLGTFGWICAGVVMSCLVLLPQAYLFAERDDRSILLANFAAMAAAVGGSVVLIPRYGIAGAAWSGFASSFALFVSCTVLAVHRYHRHS